MNILFSLDVILYCEYRVLIGSRSVHTGFPFSGSSNSFVRDNTFGKFDMTETTFRRTPGVQISLENNHL